MTAQIPPNCSAAGKQRSYANRLSVMLELADCLSGVWAYNADRSRAILEQGDIEEGLNAAIALEMTGFRWNRKVK